MPESPPRDRLQSTRWVGTLVAPRKPDRHTTLSGASAGPRALSCVGRHGSWSRPLGLWRALIRLSVATVSVGTLFVVPSNADATHWRVSITNGMTGRTRSWTLAAPDRRAVRAGTSGWRCWVTRQFPARERNPDMAHVFDPRPYRHVVCGNGDDSYSTRVFTSERLDLWLKRAGRSRTHWRLTIDGRSMVPGIAATNRTPAVSGGRVTCGGTSGSLDMSVDVMTRYPHCTGFHTHRIVDTATPLPRPSMRWRPSLASSSVFHVPGDPPGGLALRWTRGDGLQIAQLLGAKTKVSVDYGADEVTEGACSLTARVACTAASDRKQAP